MRALSPRGVAVALRRNIEPEGVHLPSGPGQTRRISPYSLDYDTDQRIRVELRTAEGEVVRGLDDPAGGTFDAAGDFDGLGLIRVRSVPQGDSRRVGYVESHGEHVRVTILNAQQMDDLLADIDSAFRRIDARLAEVDIGATRALAARQRRGLDRLRVIAQSCKEQPSLYVWFTDSTPEITSLE
jgi:hypothetical protein